jgi:hypothetical protein
MDPLWDPDTRKRTLVYQRLARDMQLPTERCHIAMFDEHQCRAAIDILKTYTKEMFIEKERKSKNGSRTGAEGH